MKRGKLTGDCLHLESHEWDTIDLLLSLGKDVEIIQPGRIKNTKSADIIMDGKKWEIKSPRIHSNDAFLIS